MNTFQLRLIKLALGDSGNFVQNLRGALELVQEEYGLSATEKKTLLGFFDQIDSINEEAERSSGFKDFTFHALLVQNFRKYGMPDNGQYFGLSFVDHRHRDAHNLFHVILGDNGSGKSSLFDAMEYVCTGTISEAVYRNISQEWFSSYHEPLRRNIILKTPRCDISTASDVFNKANIDVSRFFFSENSIVESSNFRFDISSRQIDQDGMNWYAFFLYALGLDKDFVDFVIERPEARLFNKTCNTLEYLKKLLSCDGTFEQKSLRELLVDKATLLSDDIKTNLEHFLMLLDDVQVNWNTTKYLEMSVEDIASKIILSFGLDRYVGSISAFADYVRQLNDIKSKIPKEDDAEASSFMKQETMFAKEIAERKNKARQELREQLFQMISAYKARFNILLSDDEAHFDLTDVIKKNSDIKAWKFAQSQPFVNEFSSESIDALLAQLVDVRKQVREDIKHIVKKIINDDFRKLIQDLFEGTFLSDKEKFEFDISHIDEERISISVNGIPVHKYFNTFRYRLFYLAIQAAINLVMMQREHFSFPMVLDDVFYANDYKNKRQLFKFFNLLESQANKMLNGSPFQVIFFTHDEQLASTLNRKNRQERTTEWKFDRIIEYEEFRNVQMYESLDENTKYFKISVPIYE